MPIINGQENSNNHSATGFVVEHGTRIPFVQIRKTLFINNKNLSCVAKCLMAHMLSRPQDWEFHFTEVLTHFTEGRDVLRNAFKELMEKGYIFKRLNRNGGKFGGTFYTIYQDPEDQEVVNYELSTGDTYLSTELERPFPEKPEAVSPFTVKRPLLIKKDHEKDKERKKIGANAHVFYSSNQGTNIVTNPQAYKNNLPPEYERDADTTKGLSEFAKMREIL